MTEPKRTGCIDAAGAPRAIAAVSAAVAVAVAVGSAIALPAAAQDPPPTPGYAKTYDFSEDWFTSNIPIWKRVLAPYRGKPGVGYLEVGVFEGRSVVWMVENVLTHETSRLTGVDIFLFDLQERYESNLARSQFAGQATTLKGFSEDVLPKLPPDSFDIVYVDGSHRARDALLDAVYSWRLLKLGGTLILDDYEWPVDLPAELEPKLGIDAFVTLFRREIEVVHRDYQLVLRKKRDRCTRLGSRCTLIGQYVYLWDSETLHERTAKGDAVALSPEENALVQALIRGAGFGDIGTPVPDDVLASETFTALKARLGLELTGQEILAE